MNILPRPQYLAELRAVEGNDLVRLLTGVRRSGKSTLLELYRHELVLTGERIPLATGQVTHVNAFDFLARRAAL